MLYAHRLWHQVLTYICSRPPTFESLSVSFTFTFTGSPFHPRKGDFGLYEALADSVPFTACEWEDLDHAGWKTTSFFTSDFLVLGAGRVLVVALKDRFQET